MAELTLEQRRAFALELLNNPVLGDIFAAQERSILAMWKGTRSEDTAKREQAWNDFRALQNVRAAIESELSRADEALGYGSENAEEDESL